MKQLLLSHYSPGLLAVGGGEGRQSLAPDSRIMNWESWLIFSTNEALCTFFILTLLFSPFLSTTVGLRIRELSTFLTPSIRIKIKCSSAGFEWVFFNTFLFKENSLSYRQFTIWPLFMYLVYIKRVLYTYPYFIKGKGRYVNALRNLI